MSRGNFPWEYIAIHELTEFYFRLKDAAAKAVAEEDPWAKHHIEKYPAELVVRHVYNPETQSWDQNETIVKMESEPFTHGAMRHCYRMKKRSTPPQSSSNHRFHNYGWTRASNFVAKAYMKDDPENPGMQVVDTSDDAKNAVKNDILLQYEASYYADKFNECNPPKTIVFIRAYAIEFVNRPGKPWFAVERYIDGNDSYGCGFTKHNTNAGFVDLDLMRVTPQVFSAHSFYISQGQRLVADIQGVGDLYTDPQVLSDDYRFGEGDLGPRGMALFFKTFRHSSLADSMGIPIFPLSKNELKHQAKYEDDEYSVSNESSAHKEMIKNMDRFARLDFNRKNRMSVLDSPLGGYLDNDIDDRTEKRSNQSHSRDYVSKSIRHSMRLAKPPLHRSTSEVDEVKQCLDLAKSDFTFDHKMFHRKESGELAIHPKNPTAPKRSSLMIRQISEPIVPTDTTKLNLGKVHYQLAVLHGLGRFPEVVPLRPDETVADAPDHDAFSVLFHLSHASALNNVPACLALGRVHAGLPTHVSNIIDQVAPIDFDAAKSLLRRAMDSPYPPSNPKAAAGCLLYQILLDDGDAPDEAVASVLEDTIKLLEESNVEDEQLKKHKERGSGGGSAGGSGGNKFHVGDRVEADYCLEGTYYPGVVEEVSEDGQTVVVKYDDDGSTESHTLDNVKLIIPPTATQTSLGGPLSDEIDLFTDGAAGDEKCLMEIYELQGELAEIYEKSGNKTAEAASLYEQAADGAMTAGKMQKATAWSLKAAELQG